jgi:hypothetical protein
MRYLIWKLVKCRATNKAVLVSPTKKGKPWNARAVRDVLTNGIYVGRYNVAGVRAQVKEYRIIDDELFKNVGEIMRRYVEGDAKRPPMSEDRKKAKIDRIFDEYFGFLKEIDDVDDTTEELCDKSH